MIFESSGSHAVLVYTDNSGLMYRHTSNITAAWDAETYLDSTSTVAIDSYFVELGRAPDGTIHLACGDTDTAQRLLAYTWNGSGWSALTSIETTLYAGPANNAYKSFALSVQPANASVVLSQAHYRWRNDDGFEQSGTATIAVDAVSTYSTSGTTKTAAASQSVSHTVSASGLNRLLLVGITMWPSASGDTVHQSPGTAPLSTKITHAQYNQDIRSELSQASRSCNRHCIMWW